MKYPDDKVFDGVIDLDDIVRVARRQCAVSGETELRMNKGVYEQKKKEFSDKTGFDFLSILGTVQLILE